MLVRSYNGEMCFLTRYDYITNADYYNKFMQIKFNHHNRIKPSQVNNIISTILYG